MKTTKIEDKFTFESGRNTQQYEEITIKFEELNQVTHGRFTVMYEKEQQISRGCILRELKVSDGVESRDLKHFWYAGWQDHKMASPEEVLALAKRVLEVMEGNRSTDTGGGGGISVKMNRAKRSKSEEDQAGRRPIVVHCSAGIGRTGCFLAILNGMQQLRSNRNVDVLAILCSLRLNRGGLVQTAEQYELVHRVLSLYCDDVEQ